MVKEAQVKQQVEVSLLGHRARWKEWGVAKTDCPALAAFIS